VGYPSRRWGRSIALAGLVLLCFAGIAAASARRGFFDYDQGRVDATIRSVTETPEACITEISYPSPVVSTYPVNNTVHGWLFLPHTAAPAPAAIVLHEWGSSDAARAKELSRELARRGVASLAMVLPLHMMRSPTRRKPGRLILTGDPPQVLANIRQAVLDVRRAADWLQQQPQVDGGRLGITGISLGAVIGDLAFGVDSRFSAAASLLGAGDVADIYWHSPLLVARQREAKRRGYTYQQVRALFAPIEATAYAGRVRPEQVLMINARHDWVLPKRAVLDLWEAFGRPCLLWTDSGHWGALLAQPQVFADAADFLAARLRLPPGEPALVQPRVPVRLRAGLFAVNRGGLSPGVSAGVPLLGTAGKVSVEALLVYPRPLLSLTVAPSEYLALGWGLPVTGGPARAYAGVVATF
jgi:dienelactone hydrolase